MAGVFTACIFPASAWSSSDLKNNLDVKALEGKRLLDVLNLLNKHDYKIVFSSSQIKSEMIVGELDHQAFGAGLEGEALVRYLLNQFQLGLRIAPNGNFIVIKKSPSDLYFDLKGTVRNRDGERVTSANVELKSSRGDRRILNANMATEAGSFHFPKVPFGRYELSAEAMGYLNYRKAIEYQAEAGKRQDNIIQVELKPLPIEKITVTTNQYDISYAQSNDQQYMQQQDIERLSHLANDINRALAHVPGIAGGDFSAKLHIRGGTTHENSFVFDGMPLYDPFHMKESGSFFTVIDAFTIGAAEIITGGATAEFGDHLSGVINLQSKDWDEDMPTALGINFLHAKVRASGHLGTSRPDDSWLLSARHGFMRVIGAVSDVELDNYNPEYSDFFGKINKQVSDDTLLTWHSLITVDKGACLNQCINGHNGQDVNQYHWLSAETQWRDDLMSNTLLGHGDLAFTRNGTEQNEQRFQLLDDDLDWNFSILKQDWRYSPNDEFLLKAGVELRKQEAEYKYSLFLSQQNLFRPIAEHPYQVEQRLKVEVDGESYGAYVAPMFRLSSHLTAEVGVRWDKQNYHKGSQISPRVNLDYLHPEYGNYKFSYGVYHQAQGIQRLLVEDGQEQFFDAQQANQLNLSYQNRFGTDIGYKLSVYHKKYEDVSPRIDSQFGDEAYIYEGRPDRITLDPESAVSKGVEIALTYAANDKVNWWMSYGYNRTLEKIDGQWSERQWDQRHSLNFGVDYQFTDSCNANVASNYHSGWRYTPVIVNQAAADTNINRPYLSLGQRFSERYQDFLSVDMRVGCEFSWSKNRLRVFFEVINLLNRRNISSEGGHYLQYNRPGSLPRVIGDDENFIPRIPSFGILWEF